MNKKYWMLLFWLVLTIVFGVIVYICDWSPISLVAVIFGALLNKSIEEVCTVCEDLSDTSNWKSSQRKLKRGGSITDNTIIRISFAYLYRIKIKDKYLLVQNSRKTGKYQPVGGVYKFQRSEKSELKNRFHIMDDNKIRIDESSQNDYRLRLENRYLRRFVKRFDSLKATRERVNNLTREFKEELKETGIIDWSQITYRYCGRYITDLSFKEHFQDYELQLFDIVELLPTPEQENDLEKLMAQKKDLYHFVTADQIASLGINTQAGLLYEWIADHTKFILQENESKLLKTEEIGNTYGPLDI